MDQERADRAREKHDLMDRIKRRARIHTIYMGMMTVLADYRCGIEESLEMEEWDKARQRIGDAYRAVRKVVRLLNYYQDRDKAKLKRMNVHDEFQKDLEAAWIAGGPNGERSKE